MVIRNLQRDDRIRLDTNDKTYFTQEGYLVDHPVVTRIGIFEYHNADGTVRKEFRPPEEVFNPESLASYKYKPVIVTHDAGYINSDNVSDEEIGTMTSEGVRDGENVTVEIVIHDTETMKESGLRELSLGYNLDLDNTPGEYNGEHYDAVQRNIRINHLALVDSARAGGNARLNVDGKDIVTVGSSEEGGRNMSKRHDGEPISAEEFQSKLEALTAKKSGEAAPAAEPKEDGDDNMITAQAEDGDDKEEPTFAERIQEVRDRRDRRDADEDPEDLEAATAKIKEQDKDIKTLLDCIDAMEAERDLQAADCGAKTDGEEDEPEEGKGQQEEVAAVLEGDEGEDLEEDEDAEEAMTLNKDSIDRIINEKLKVTMLGVQRMNMDSNELIGKSLVGMKKAILKKAMPKMNFDGKSKGYIKHAFQFWLDNMPEKKDANYQRWQMGMGARMDRADVNNGITSAMLAREAMMKRNEGGNV